jgi:aminoglycoside phosphotransferase (APT) family kinase protein
MGRTQAEPVTYTRSATSLVKEEIKDDTYILRCKIPWNATVPAPQKRYLRRDDVFSHFTIWGGPATIIFPLSSAVRSMLGLDEIPGSDVSATLPRSMAQLLSNGELLYRSEPDMPRLLIKVSPTIIVKIRPFLPQDETTEYTSMKYLEDHLPELPIPRTYGLIHIRKTAYLFMSYTPDPSLENLWPKLDHMQKTSVQEQLQDILSKLRQLQPKIKDRPLGGLSGEGCVDTRGTTRYSQKPVMNAAGFTDFLFTHDGNADPIYVRFLRKFLPSDDITPIVFTHGDLRPANILARLQSDGSCLITSIIDWENSGFYPDYFECMKCTNMLSPMGTSDWFEYLPPVLSPLQHPTRWLVDRIWDRQVGI